MKNKFIKALSITLALSTVLTSCDEQALTDLNVDQNASTEIDLSFLLAYGQLRVAGQRYDGWRTNLIYSSTMIQHNAALAGYWSGDKYYYNAQYSGAYWERHYPDAIKNLTHVMDETEGNPNLVNLNAAAKVMRAFDLHRMTDLYGDIPYEQAGRGILGEENWFPKYDTQQEVYGYLVRDLRAARDAFSAGVNPLGSQDVLFQGDVDKWRKFANSLLMRVALRMSNVDPGTAQSVFTEAAGGAMTSVSESALLTQQDGPSGDLNQNGTSMALSNEAGGGGDAGNCRVSKTLVDFMTETNDPRKMIIVGGVGAPFDPSTWNTDPDAQVGLPNGYTTITITDVNPDHQSLNEYSFINRGIMDPDDPSVFLTYAEVELMKAEAAVKGWLSSSAEEHFTKGVTAAIQQWESFGPYSVDPAEITPFIEGLGFAAASNEDKMRMIGEQFWMATYLNHVETWSNWRRTGYPVLTPTNDPNSITNGVIPRRLQYFEQEAGSNPDNYAAAVARMGGDILTTKVWWDGGN